jgi:hypothetical protein
MNETTGPGAAKRFIKSISPIIKGDGLEHSFGWAISTADEHVIKDNAAEDGVTTGEAFLDAITKDSMQLERNIMRVMRHIGLSLRDEGHGDDELIGSGWLNEGGTAWRLWETLDDQKTLRCYSGLDTLFHDCGPMLWNKIGEHGRRYLDDSYFRFLDPWPGPEGTAQEESKRPTARALLDNGVAKSSIMAFRKALGKAHILLPVQDREAEYEEGVLDEITLPLGAWLEVMDQFWVKEAGREENGDVYYQSIDLYVTEFLSALESLGISDVERHEHTL